MSEPKVTAYPTMPILHWWTLRKRFKERISDIVPGIVTAKYLAGILSIRENTAKNTLVPCLVATGLLDEDGRTQKRLENWLEDERYAVVCQDIRDDIYPRELLQNIPDPSKAPLEAEAWFARNTGSSMVDVRKMYAFYNLLCDADLSKGPTAGQPRRHDAYITEPDEPGPGVALNVSDPQAMERILGRIAAMGYTPGVTINYSINITKDTPEDQIDHIFRSLARHLKPKKRVRED